MKSSMGTTLATYGLLCLAGGISLMLPDAISPATLETLHPAVSDALLVAGVAQFKTDGAVETGSEQPASYDHVLTLNRREDGTVAHLDTSFWPQPERHGEAFSYTFVLPFVHDARRGRFLIVDGADDLEITVNGHAIPDITPTTGGVRFDELVFLADGSPGAVRVTFVREAGPESLLSIRTNLAPASTVQVATAH